MKKQFNTIILLIAAVLAGPALFAQAPLCEGEEVCLTITARGDIQWQSSQDSISWVNESGATQDTFCLVPSAGTHYFRAWVLEGTCDTLWSDPVTISIRPQPTADAGPDITTCFGANVVLGGNPSASGGTAPYTYLWTPASGLSSPTDSNPTATLSGPMEYVLLVTDTMGCMDTDTVLVDTSGQFASGSMMFSYSGQIDTFIVPQCVTMLTVEAWGAQGGGGTGNGVGGKGARLKGDFVVAPGDTLLILVGQQGLTNYGYGGGGGSFVVAMDTTPLVVAGGGGGAEHNNNYPGFDAVLTTSGMDVESALGGTNGMGGQLGNPNTSGCGWSGSGGGGLLGDGADINNGGGAAFVNGGAGGIDPTTNCVVAGFGGFGGGGASGNAGGGGGGYSGGAGGANIGVVPNRGGGGGGSINTGTNQSNTAGVQFGNGQVEITW